MTQHARKFFFILLGLVFILGFSPIRGQTETSGNHMLVELTPAWTTGIISSDAARAKIVVADLNQDSKTDIASCSGGNIYVLNYNASGTYDTIWYSEYIKCAKLVSADRDSDGFHELYAASSDGRVFVFDGADFQSLGTFTLPSTTAVNDLVVADADNDSALEIILARTSETLFYSADTFTLEWQATGLGGDQVAIGNIDDDPSFETVVNSNPAHVLDASMQSQKWGYTGGFGSVMDLGDVDGDGRAEIIYISGRYYAYAMDGETQTIKWQRNDLNYLNSLKVADVDKDGISEVLIGDGQLGNVSGYNGNTGATLWSIPNPVNGVYEIGVGDTNDDGVNEIVFGAGQAPNNKNTLYIGSWVSQTVTWTADDIEGGLYVASGDLDHDGQGEIVMASYRSNYNQSGMIRVYDGATRQIEWSTIISEPSFQIHYIALSQLDADEALEIVICGTDQASKTRIIVYDGISHAVEFTSPDMGSGSPRGLLVMNLDLDPNDEIIVGLDNDQIQVLNGASPVIQWSSGTLDGDIADFALGDLDGDGVTDLAVLTTRSAYIYNTSPWGLKRQQAISNGTQITFANENLNGSGELLITTYSYTPGTVLIALDGLTYATLWQHPLGNVLIRELVAADLEADGNQEYILIGSSGLNLTDPGFMWVGSESYVFTWEYKMAETWETLKTMNLFDVDNDGKTELILSGTTFIQIREISGVPKPIYEVFLPNVANRYPPGLYGKVTEHGTPAANILLELRFFNGTNWSTKATTYTASDGTYSFTNNAILNPGQYYYVRFSNGGYDSTRLWTWHTQSVDSTMPVNNFHIGDFDVEDVFLSYPWYSHESFPVTFQWSKRVTTTDSYEFNLFDPGDGSPYFYTDPPLGYVDSYTLNSLPPGFSTGYWYVWEIWVYSPDGGFGISNSYLYVNFNNTGYTPKTDIIPLEPKVPLDLEGWQDRK